MANAAEPAVRAWPEVLAVLLTARGWLVAAMLWGVSALAGAASTTWNFKVYLDSKPIGNQSFTLTEQGEVRAMSVKARFAVNFFAIFPYRYVHDATESWHGNCLTGLIASTDDNGKLSHVNVSSDGDSLLVSGPKGKQNLQGCVMSFAYWNPEVLKQAHLLNPQTGAVEAVRVETLGEEPIDVRGSRLMAHHYRITGSQHPIDLWYSDAGQWLSLMSQVEGGRHLILRLE